MERFIEFFTYINQYMIYIYLIIGLFLLLFIINLLFKLSKLSKTTNLTIDKINQINISINDSKTKANISGNAIGNGFRNFVRLMSLIQVIKYFIKKDNRRKDKEFKRYEKNKEKLLKAIG